MRLHPIHRPPNGPTCCWWGVRGGMGPHIIASHVDLRGLPGFNARKPNRYLLRWVTQEINDFRFELSINGTPSRSCPGSPGCGQGRVDRIRIPWWDAFDLQRCLGLNRGGRRVVSPGPAQPCGGWRWDTGVVSR
ncbi:MAG: hypothetical protein CM1200mP2_48780 [Planctomycetaceae bacterium]|nr:MAG: hypothetical protein CM1200mP2_48780 [Planctomycetaceae bacterium]